MKGTVVVLGILGLATALAAPAANAAGAPTVLWQPDLSTGKLVGPMVGGKEAPVFIQGVNPQTVGDPTSMDPGTAPFVVVTKANSANETDNACSCDIAVGWLDGGDSDGVGDGSTPDDLDPDPTMRVYPSELLQEFGRVDVGGHVQLVQSSLGFRGPPDLPVQVGVDRPDQGGDPFGHLGGRGGVRVHGLGQRGAHRRPGVPEGGHGGGGGRDGGIGGVVGAATTEQSHVSIFAEPDEYPRRARDGESSNTSLAPPIRVRSVSGRIPWTAL